MKWISLIVFFAYNFVGYKISPYLDFFTIFPYMGGWLLVFDWMMTNQAKEPEDHEQKKIT